MMSIRRCIVKISQDMLVVQDKVMISSILFLTVTQKKKMLNLFNCKYENMWQRVKVFMYSCNSTIQ